MKTPWSDQKTTDHFLQPTQELYNSNNSALMWAWAAAETAALKHKDPSFSSNASNHETSHNSLCRLTNYLFSHWKALTVLPSWASKSQTQSKEQNMGELWVWTGRWDKRQSEKKSLQNNSNKSEKHWFSVYAVGGIDKPYLLCFSHNYTINQTPGSNKNSLSIIGVHWDFKFSTMTKRRLKCSHWHLVGLRH